MPEIVAAAVAVKWFPDVTDPEVELRAAEAYVSQRCSWPTVDAAGVAVPPPPDLVEAVRLLTARYLARRNSADGLVGMNELGPVRVTREDADVQRLIAPWRKVAFA